MAYVNVINKQDDNNVLSGFGTVIINTDAIEADKELLVPYGYELDSEIALKVAFINGHNCVDASTPLTVKIKYADGSYIEESGNPKEIAVKVNQYGTLVNLPIHNISSTYKCLDPNTVLEMYYNGTDFVVIGNPTVLASDNYEIKANGKNTALEAHPIHSLYWSSDSTSPNILFGGGTWVQIKDRFILSAGDTYANGATGGASTVTLTVNQLPSHTHNAGHGHSASSGSAGDHFHGYTNSVPVATAENLYSTTGGGAYGLGYTNQGVQTGSAGSHSHTISVDYLDMDTGPVGHNYAHENMPPYVAKYCWERTA